MLQIGFVVNAPDPVGVLRIGVLIQAVIFVEAHAAGKNVEEHGAVFSAVKETRVVTAGFEDCPETVQSLELRAEKSFIAQVGQAGKNGRRRIDGPPSVGESVLEIESFLGEGIQERRVTMARVADAGKFCGEALDNNNDDIFPRPG